VPGKSEVEVVDQVVLAQFPAQRASDVKAGPIRDSQRREWSRFHRHVGCQSRRAGERGDGSYGYREFLHEKPLEFGHYNEQPCPNCYRPATVNNNSTGQDRMNPVSPSHGFVVSKIALGARTSSGYSENSPAPNLGMTEGRMPRP
jgi:hypothetical protein